jgi:hypothetical protein
MAPNDSVPSAWSSQVRLVPQAGVRNPALGGSRRYPGKMGISPTRWIVRSVVVATTTFALLDLFLLVSGSSH